MLATFVVQVDGQIVQGVAGLSHLLERWVVRQKAQLSKRTLGRGADMKLSKAAKIAAYVGLTLKKS